MKAFREFTKFRRLVQNWTKEGRAGIWTQVNMTPESLKKKKSLPVGKYMKIWIFFSFELSSFIYQVHLKKVQ